MQSRADLGDPHPHRGTDPTSAPAPTGCRIPAFPSYLPLLGFALQGPHHCHINILKGSGEAGGWQGCTGPGAPPASVPSSNGSPGQRTPNHGRAKGLPHCRSGAKPTPHRWGEAEPWDSQWVAPYHVILGAVIADVRVGQEGLA